MIMETVKVTMQSGIPVIMKPVTKATTKIEMIQMS